jgi:hypothetical protein
MAMSDVSVCEVEALMFDGNAQIGVGDAPSGWNDAEVACFLLPLPNRPRLLQMRRDRAYNRIPNRNPFVFPTTHRLRNQSQTVPYEAVYFPRVGGVIRPVLTRRDLSLRAPLDFVSASRFQRLSILGLIPRLRAVSPTP